ncbi:MAG: squalene synthase HpnC [Planctomycetota bacterium]
MPDAPPASELKISYEKCELLAQSRLENFPVLSNYISPEHSHHLAAVYAFCRIADDAADECETALQALQKLDAIHNDLDCVFGVKRPAMFEFLALQATVRERRLSRRPFEQLLDAFRQDQRKTRYETWDELIDYSKRSANPVGELVLSTAGEFENADIVNHQKKIELSNQICTGLQLANFWQDISKDYKIGRIYIPADAMARHGVSESDIAGERCTPAFCSLLAELCNLTEPLFVEGSSLADIVGSRLKIPILAFAIAGHELIQRIRAAKFDVFTRRPEIGELPLKKILARAAAARFIRSFRPKIAVQK